MKRMETDGKKKIDKTRLVEYTIVYMIGDADRACVLGVSRGDGMHTVLRQPAEHHGHRAPRVE